MNERTTYLNRRGGVKHRDKWEVAVHEAGHWVFYEWLGLGNPVAASIVPVGDSAGRVSCPLGRPRTELQFRHNLLAVVAGAAAVNVVLGKRGFVEGTDFFTCWELADSIKPGCSQRNSGRHVRAAMRIAEELVRDLLWESVLTCASVLHDHRVLGREQMRDVWFTAMPEDYPWAITYRHKLQALWRRMERIADR
jgi:hypothetical protein